MAIAIGVAVCVRIGLEVWAVWWVAGVAGDAWATAAGVVIGVLELNNLAKVLGWVGK